MKWPGKTNTFWRLHYSPSKQMPLRAQILRADAMPGPVLTFVPKLFYLPPQPFTEPTV